jgi:steroid delta-isomerase-like uncharacterized protein
MYDLKQHLADFAASKWNEWKAGLASDVIYEEIATHTRVKGAEEYLKIVLRWKRAYPDLKPTVLNMVSAGDKIFAEIEWEGTHTGPLEGPFGMIAATNKRGLVRASLFVTVKNDKVVELHHYFDMMTLLANLGILPFAGAPVQTQKPAVLPAR